MSDNIYDFRCKIRKPKVKIKKKISKKHISVKKPLNFQYFSILAL